jgi:hypothetical protein
MLRWKDAPYVFTLLVGTFGFLFNQVIDKLNDAPIVEYSFDTMKGQNGLDSGTLTLKNISDKVSFDSICLTLKYSSDCRGCRLSNPRIKTIHFASLLGRDQQGSPDESRVTYTLMNFQPHTEYRLSYNFDRGDKKYVNPFIYVDSKQPVWFEESSGMTYCIRNQLIIILVAGFIVLVLLIVYACTIKKTP